MIRSHRATWLVGLYAAVLTVLMVPVVANDHMRWRYQQTVAHWLSKVRNPNTVFIGDSITAGGKHFNSLDTINLGSSGLETYQIASELDHAVLYHPRHIVVMAGVNDAVGAHIDDAQLAAAWEKLTLDPRMIVTLAPHTRYPALNRTVEKVNAVATAAALRHGRPIIDLDDELMGKDGLIKPDYTVDGIHFSPPAYAIWQRRLAAMGI